MSAPLLDALNDWVVACLCDPPTAGSRSAPAQTTASDSKRSSPSNASVSARCRWSGLLST
jgi:hypothetical protein